MPRLGLVQAFALAVFGSAALQALVLWPAAAHLPLSPVAAWAILAASLALAARLAAGCGAVPAAGLLPPHETGSAAAAAAGATRGSAARFAWLAALVTLGFGAWLFGALWRLVWLRPVYDWDGLYYHLPAMNAWASAGRVHWIPTMFDLPFANGYPMALETLGFLVLRLAGTSRLVDGGNLFAWPLAALGLAVIAARLGAHGPWRLAPAGLIAAVPGWVILSSTCYVDPGFAAAAAAALAGALLWAGAAPEHGPHLALLFGAAGGLMIGAKGQGLPFFGIALAFAAIARASRMGGASRALFTQAGTAALVAFATGGYWTLRNLVWSGNPIFPIELKLGAKVLAAGYDTGSLLAGNMPEWLRAWPAWLRVPVAWAEPDAPVRGYAATGGLGPLWLAAGLPALAALPVALRRERSRLAAFALLLAIGAAWLAVQPAPWWARMTLWLHALGLPALAAVLAAAARARHAALAWAAPLALLAALAVGASASLGAYEAERTSGLGADGGYRSSAEALFPGLEAACPEFLAASRIARGPWSRFGTLLGGVLAQPLDARRIHPVADLDAARVRALRAEGIEWVVWDEVASPAPAALRAAALDSCAYRPQPDQRFLMLRIARSHERPGITRR